ncbi:unnamed protein product [Soboliphyme baturini]|uniref:Craniofacial development protein 2-like n=1 Tax=Soboliphyme baturini TaxID=241478 RepID=A0A183J2U9_9BILA|nr:unnamed protein product [Soboliphyme baturini]
MNKKWSLRILSCRFSSPRVGILLLRLDSNKTLKIVQVYASDVDEVEKLYAELESTLTVKATYTVVMGDFNAKLGR